MLTAIQSTHNTIAKRKDEDRDETLRQIRVAQQLVLAGRGDDAQSSLSDPQFVVNGDPTGGFRSVGLVGNQRRMFCSGTLIGSRHVLTAAHCAIGVGDTRGRFRVDGKTYSTSRVFVHPRYNDNTLANDIAIYELSSAVTGVRPSRIFRGTPRVGQTLKLVGFGGGGDGSGHNGDFGTKRVGHTKIDGVTGSLITWRFDNDLESNTAPGDSGGPAFLNVNGELQVAGITSGGTNQDASIGDHSFDTRVDAYQKWIDNIISPAPPPKPKDDHSNKLNRSATNLVVRNNAATGRGRFEKTGDRDVFEVKFKRAGQTTISLDANANSDLDLFLRVYSANGKLIAQNDDRKSSLNSRLILNHGARRYYVSARAYEDNGTGKFVLRLNQQSVTRDKISANFGRAKSIRFRDSNRSKTFSAIVSRHDVDMFRVTVNVSGTLAISARQKSGDLDTKIKLYDKRRNRIGSNNNSRGTKDASFDLRVKAGDTIFLELYGVGRTQGDYVLDLQQRPNRRLLSENGDAGLPRNVSLTLADNDAAVAKSSAFGEQHHNLIGRDLTSDSASIAFGG